jgi:hypothetical protein
MSKWEIIGRMSSTSGGHITKTYDKMTKSFIVLLIERDTHIRYPKLLKPF